MNPEVEILCNRLLGALVNGAYQGLLLTVGIWLCLRLQTRANAATRHAALLATLLIIVLLPVTHFLIAELDGYSNPFTEPINMAMGTREDERDGEDATASADISDSDVSSTASDLENSTPREEKSFISRAALFAREFKAGFLVASDWPLTLPKGGAIIGVVLWISIASARLARLARQYCLLRSFKHTGKTASQEVVSLFERCRRQMGVARKTTLVMSQECSTPMAVGFRHPAVLLPAKMFEGPASVQLESVLRHELAHICRRDDWANLVQQVIHSLLFFHPAIHWLSRRLTIEREIACDDHVLAATQTPKEYALFLTEFAGRKNGRGWAAAPAAWHNKSQLKERINMILNSKRNASPRLARLSVSAITAAAIIFGILAMQAGPRVALASEENEKVQTSAKDEERVKPAAEPVAVAVASPRPAPVPSVPAIGAVPAAPVAVQVDTDLPVKVKPPRAPKVDSIERRLERLERMVESLLAREKGKRDGDDREQTNYKKNNSWEKEKLEMLAEEHAKMAGKLAKSGVDEEQIARMTERAKREAERASQQADRAMKEAKRALEEAHLDKHNQQPGYLAGQSLNQMGIQRKSLEAQHRALEKQMAAIEKQLGRLEAGQKKMEEREVEKDRKHGPGSPAPKGEAEDDDAPRKRKQ